MVLVQDDSIRLRSHKLKVYRTHPSHDEIWFRTSSAFNTALNHRGVECPGSQLLVSAVCHVTKNFDRLDYGNTFRKRTGTELAKVYQVPRYHCTCGGHGSI